MRWSPPLYVIFYGLFFLPATDEFSKKNIVRLSYEPHGSIVSTPAKSAGESLTQTGPPSKKVSREDSSHMETEDRGTLWKSDVTSREHISKITVAPANLFTHFCIVTQSPCYGYE